MGFLDRFKKNKKEGTGLANLPVQANLSVSQTTPKLAFKKGTGSANLSIHYHVLLRPLISEKAAVAESRGVYTFMVARHANKQQIKQAITAIYKVKPKKVRVINKEGKVVRHGRSIGRRSDWKKAIVTLPPGQSISIHEGV